jgi:hypothetical protein
MDIETAILAPPEIEYVEVARFIPLRLEDVFGTKTGRFAMMYGMSEKATFAMLEGNHEHRESLPSLDKR